MTNHLILASSSLGRKRLLDYLKIPYEIIPSNLDEDKIIGKNPIDTIKIRARLKGEDVAKFILPRTYNLKPKTSIILSADSDAILDGKLYSKPKSYKEAVNTLKSLSGRTHEFVTAVYIIKLEKAPRSRPGLEHAVLTSSFPRRRESRKAWIPHQVRDDKIILDEISRSFVTFRRLADVDIKLYLKVTEYTKYAGAYALSSAQNFITKIKGSVSNVIGLPLELVIPILKKEKLLPKV